METDDLVLFVRVAELGSLTATAGATVYRFSAGSVRWSPVLGRGPWEHCRSGI